MAWRAEDWAAHQVGHAPPIEPRPRGHSRVAQDCELYNNEETRRPSTVTCDSDCARLCALWRGARVEGEKSKYQNAKEEYSCTRSRYSATGEWWVEW
eukprot:2875378-Prymnesium_polylepis.2